MDDQTVLVRNGMKVATNACITSHRAEFTCHDPLDFRLYFERLTFVCAPDRLMFYPVTEAFNTVREVREKGLLFEFPFSEIAEIGNSWPEKSGLPETPFRRPAFGILRSEPLYVVMKSGHVLVLLYNNACLRGRPDPLEFGKEAHKLLISFRQWREEERRKKVELHASSQWQAVGSFFEKLFSSKPKEKETEEIPQSFPTDFTPGFRVPISRSAAITAAAEERKLMSMALRWLRQTEERAAEWEERKNMQRRSWRERGGKLVTPSVWTHMPFTDDDHISMRSSQASDLVDSARVGEEDDGPGLCTHNECPQEERSIENDRVSSHPFYQPAPETPPPKKERIFLTRSHLQAGTPTGSDPRLPSHWVVLEYDGDPEMPTICETEEADVPGTAWQSFWRHYSPPEWRKYRQNDRTLEETSVQPEKPRARPVKPRTVQLHRKASTSSTPRKQKHSIDQRTASTFPLAAGMSGPKRPPSQRRSPSRTQRRSAPKSHPNSTSAGSSFVRMTEDFFSKWSEVMACCCFRVSTVEGGHAEE
uniref:Uncharacterized protein n=1 Tax=Chromera velia CCMP2878 TaxID=1169474 RepID=A0A0G4G6G4_9ALVE|eukprot:Cvel_20503.t1-p1 / transcript=Cvel_20503.t1 / gene=Cvel_20503 / organism=Chromera_velia_CCMP2878 / gene_product=hypothetical protein / transcript_product=hypothetical protein / location=Cvel_scaffold1845:10889-12484(+) / protein_length=532 / sequence_SO=supercontig / SO=protein_coding / is_pseudo=false